MGRYSKPGVNWADIEIRWRTGGSEAALAKEYGISRQAVNQRRKREGWERGNPRQQIFAENVDANLLSLASETDTAKRLANPVTQRDKQLVAHGKRTPENLAAILQRVENGVPEGIAAQAVGIDPGTLRNWKEDDETTRELIEAARARAVAKKVERIEKAGERGDWKADSWYLERKAPEDFAAKDKYGSGEKVEIIINFDRDAMASTEDNMIDVTPDEETVRPPETDVP